MDAFRTEVTVIPRPPIDHQQVIITTGSCFSDAIGNRLVENKFDTSVNPFGTSYNPISIHRTLTMACDPSTLSTESFTSREGTWFHYDFHSQFNGETRDALAEKLERRVEEARSWLARADVILITYGTAWVFRKVDTQQIVANCHKQPAAQFQKQLLSVSEITEDFERLLAQVRSLRPNLRVILTLSPVRHTKDTLELNQVSKSILRQAIFQITERNPAIEYFPAYEIMLDDLRDYRFYASDLIHPSDLAIDYIWDKFIQAYFNSTTKNLCERWQKVRRSMQHRPFHPRTEGYRLFLSSVVRDLDELKNSLNVSQEIAEAKRQLRAFDLA